MSRPAFVAIGSRALPVANDGAGERYAAAQHHLMPGTQTPATSHPCDVTLIFVERGVVEVMVNGAATFVTGPALIRIPSGTVHACSNPTDWAVRLLIRRIPPSPRPRVVRAFVEYAA